MGAVLFAALAGMLFGVFAVVIRRGLQRGGDPEVGAVVVTGIGVLTSALLAIPSVSAGDVHPGDLWPFLLIGALVPGATQILFIVAIRDIGPSRVSILIGTAPLMSVAIALALLGEPFQPLLVLGTVLVVAGGAALARERTRPEHYRAFGAGRRFAPTCGRRCRPSRSRESSSGSPTRACWRPSTGAACRSWLR